MILYGEVRLWVCLLYGVVVVCDGLFIVRCVVLCVCVCVLGQSGEAQRAVSVWFQPPK